MVNLLEQKLHNYPRSYISDDELQILLDGTANSRHALVKRALASQQLLRLKRGVYCLNSPLVRQKPHPFELAQKIYNPSYISLESALAYHQLIPEAVHGITSVTPKRSATFKTPLGEFSYHTLPSFNFFVQVDRYEENERYFFIASPWKAIADYVFCYKKEWRGIEPLINSLRIEPEDLPRLETTAATELINYYKRQRLTRFLEGVMQDLSS